MISPAQAYVTHRRRSRPNGQATAAALADIDDEVNTFGKRARKVVTNLDDLIGYVAQGGQPADPWRPVGRVDSAADIVPA